MLIKPERPWSLRENDITPEATWLNRRQLLTTMGLGGGLIAGGLLPRLLKQRSPAFRQCAILNLPSTVTSPMKKRRRPTPISMSLAHRRISGGRPAAEARPMGCFNRWHGRKITIDAANLMLQLGGWKNGLPSPMLRHGPWLYHGRSSAVGELPQAGAKYIKFETFEDKNIAGSAAGLVSVAVCRRPDD